MPILAPQVKSEDDGEPLFNRGVSNGRMQAMTQTVAMVHCLQTRPFVVPLKQPTVGIMNGRTC
jgi:hypothetical protein